MASHAVNPSGMSADLFLKKGYDRDNLIGDATRVKVTVQGHIRPYTADYTEAL